MTLKLLIAMGIFKAIPLIVGMDSCLGSQRDLDVAMFTIVMPNF